MAPIVSRKELLRIIQVVSSPGQEEAPGGRASVDSTTPFIVIPITMLPPSTSKFVPHSNAPQNQHELGLGNSYRNIYASEASHQGNSRGNNATSSSSSISPVTVEKISRVLSAFEPKHKTKDLAIVTADLTSEEAILAIKVLSYIGIENDERVMDALNCLRRRIDPAEGDLAIGGLSINNVPAIPQLPKMAAPYERVGSNYTITIVDSKIPGAGKGLVVKEAVPANMVVFVIGKPTIHIITSTKKDLSVSCEYCLADLTVAPVDDSNSSSGSSGSSDTSSDDGYTEVTVEKLSCPGCKMFFYCGGKAAEKKCMEKAWDEYHKYECQVFQRILKLEKDSHLEGPTMLLDPEYRGMLRMVSLRYSEEIDDEEWKRIQGLLVTTDKSNNFYDKIKVFIRGITKEANILAAAPAEELSVQEIEDLFRKLEQNRMEMLFPLPKKDDGPVSFVNVGYIVDTFAAMLNHDCEPNVTWHSEGRELHIVATRDIQEGEELLMSYIENREKRREKLWSWWGIDCSCKLCTEDE